MTGIIDYAGLFPPSKLSLNKAIHHYADYRKSDDAWMLSRFIIPASKLSKISEHADELFTTDDLFKFSVLGEKKETIEGFKEEISAVINFCTAFGEKYAGFVSTDILEVKLPHEAARSQNSGLIKDLMNEVAEQLQDSPLAPSVIFYEGLFDEDWRANNEAVIQAIADHKDEFLSDSNYRLAAYKIRCGGVEKGLFPSVEQVAFALNSAREKGVGLKGTAGLHHPVRHYADEVNIKMHGFFNVFGGAMLAHANDFDSTTLQSVLKEENPATFSFTDTEFSWKDYSVTTDKIKSLRKESLLSYGSCSFDEPREDLTQLKLL